MGNTLGSQVLFTGLFAGILLTPVWALETKSNSPSLGNGDLASQKILLELPTPMFFMTPDGVATYVASGEYNVKAGKREIRLTPVHEGEGEFILVKAQQHGSNQPVNSAEARLRKAPAQHPDLVSVVLVSVDGHLYEAIGSKTGVWPRYGWSAIKNAAIVPLDPSPNDDEPIHGIE